MTTAEDLAASTFVSRNPAGGEVVGTFPVHGPDAVAEAVGRARPAAEWWAAIGFAERERRLLAFKGVLTRRSDELCELVRRENGKPVADAFLEVLATVEHLDWAARKAERALAPRWVGPGPLMVHHKVTVAHEPFGVVGVIGPWNYPVLTPMGSIGYALAAGNAVIYKPSEYTPAVGEWLVDAFATVVPEHQVLQLLTGAGETGAALCRSGVDKLAFTGSASTGRRVMATCAETLTPMLMEYGGNDTLIVDDDADVDAAAVAAVWGGLQNAGQACISVERIFATDAVYDRFVDTVAGLARNVRSGQDGAAHIGAITMPAQIDTIEAHLVDALRRGATAVVGGRESVQPPYVNPVVLVDVPGDARIMREETFGPILPITRVADADEAIAIADSTSFSLAVTVFSRSRGEEIAQRLRAGMVSVNASSAAFSGVPAAPWGGVGESGFGRIHGEEGLKEFTRPKAVITRRFDLPFELFSFERPAWLLGALDRVMKLRHGRR